MTYNNTTVNYGSISDDAVSAWNDAVDSYILFLTEYNGSYYVCGAFQGRFIEREGYVFQQATEDTKLRGYTPISVEDFADSLTGLTVENDKTE